MKYSDYKKQALKDSKLKAEYDALEPEYQLIQAMIDARIKQNITQKQLSEKTGITQADISRIENGSRNRKRINSIFNFPFSKWKTIIYSKKNK